MADVVTASHQYSFQNVVAVGILDLKADARCFSPAHTDVYLTSSVATVLLADADVYFACVLVHVRCGYEDCEFCYCADCVTPDDECLVQVFAVVMLA